MHNTSQNNQKHKNINIIFHKTKIGYMTGRIEQALNQIITFAQTNNMERIIK